MRGVHELNKRAVTVGFLAILILLIAIFVILLLFQGKFKTNLEEKSVIDKCRISVYGAHVENKLAYGATSDISGDEFADKIKCSTVAKTLSGKEQELKHQLAGSMLSCWNMFRGDELSFFSKGGIFCHVCNVIGFDDKTMTIAGFGDFLKKNSPAGSKVSYFGAIPSLYVDFPLDASLKTDKTYSVVYTYARGEPINSFFQKLIMILSQPADANSVYYQLSLVDSGQLSKLDCRSIPKEINN